jgi:GGDEF domain-containing protein
MAGSTKLEITASIGATLALPDDTPESIIHRADTLMYASKTLVGNRVTTDQ